LSQQDESVDPTENDFLGANLDWLLNEAESFLNDDLFTTGFKFTSFFLFLFSSS